MTIVGNTAERIASKCWDGGLGSDRRGTTLLEIMVVITIIGLIMSVVAINVVKVFDCAKQKRVLMDFSNIRASLDLYRARTGQYPTTADGLSVLVSTQIINRPALDPWGNEYLYVFEGGRFTITTYGADGAPGGAADNADLNS